MFYVEKGYQIATVMSTSSNLLSTIMVSPTNATAPPSTLVSISPMHQTAPSGLSSSKNVGIGIGVGVTVGALALGVLLFVLVRQLRRQRQKDLGHAGTLNFVEGAPPNSRRYEKPELTGEDGSQGNGR